MKVHNLSMGIAQAYLLETEDGLVLVDAGSRGCEFRVLKLMQMLGPKDLRLVFISHAHLDHYGSAAALQRWTNVPIAVHHMDAGAMSRGETPLGSVRGRGWLVKPWMPILMRLIKLEPIQPDRMLEDEEHLDDFGLDAKIIHLPGHTLGSACLLVENRLAFVGDLVSTNGHPHVQQFYAHDWKLIPSSLARLQALQPEWVFPGHGRYPLDRQTFQALANQYLRSNV